MRGRKGVKSIVATEYPIHDNSLPVHGYAFCTLCETHNVKYCKMGQVWGNGSDAVLCQKCGSFGKLEEGRIVKRFVKRPTEEAAT